MTRTNEKLLEKPDHGHYPVCLQRKDDIDRSALLTLKYTLIVSGMLVFLTLCTFRPAVVSWIPSLLGESTEVAPFFLQLLISLMPIAMAGINCGKRKVFGMILFGFYIAQAVFGFICMSSNFVDVFSLILGLGGVATSFRAVSDYLDWKQLMETEGFPHFNLRYTEQIENPDYVPVYNGKDQSDHMSEAEKITELLFTQKDSIMPGIAEAKPALKGDPDYVFRPAGGKHCSMSESPIKTA